MSSGSIEALQKCGILTGERDSCQFNFVGVCSTEDAILAISPKIFANADANESSNMQRIAKTIRVLKKYGKNSENECEGIGNLETSVQSLTVSEFITADFLIRDYLQYGVYSKRNDRISINVPGEALWEKTVDNITPIINRRRPFYPEILNRIEEDNAHYIISSIHKTAYCYSVSKYAALLGYDQLSVPQGCMKDFSRIGPDSMLSAAIMKELREVYHDREILLLKALYQLINPRYSSSSGKKLSFFGTSSFHVIWEGICSTVMNNEFSKYEDVIPKPVWQIDGQKPVLKKTLRPDIIRTIPPDKMFLLMDAKYYYLKYEKADLKGNPGVEDVAKQLFYSKALSGERKNWEKFFNLFLFPSRDITDSFYSYIGTVSLDFIGEDPVRLFSLSVEKLFEMYLKNEILADEQLKNMVRRIDGTFWRNLINSCSECPEI